MNKPVMASTERNKAILRAAGRRDIARPHGFFFGKTKETGIWISSKSRRFRIIFGGHDSFYLCFGRFRIRIKKLATLEEDNK